MSDGRNQPSPWEALQNQIYLGSDTFVAKMQAKVEKNKQLSEIPKTQRREVAKPLTWYFEHNANHDVAVYEAFQTGTYNMREIGEQIGLHYSRISRIIMKRSGEARGKT